MSEKFFTLWDWLGQIPDPRDTSGRRYSLQSILGLITAGLMSGKTSLRSISKWGRALSRSQLLRLNIRRQSPSQTTMHYLLIRMNPEEIEHAMRNWIEGTFLEKWFTEKLSKIDMKTFFNDDYAALNVLAEYCSLISDTIQRMAQEMKSSEFTAHLAMLKDILNIPVQIPVPVRLEPLHTNA